jgi:Predicted membrane protein
MSNYSPKPLLAQLLKLPSAVWARMAEDRLPRHAASLAFSSLLALAPMMALALAMLSLFTPLEQLGGQLESFIYQYLVPTVSDDVKIYIDQFASQAGKLSLFGLVFFVLTAILLLATIESSFNDIWRVRQGRTLTARLTVYWALVSLGPLLMGASLSLSTYFLSLSIFTGQVQSAGLLLLPWLLVVAAFLLLYLIMPNVRVAFVHALGGAVVASILFELSKRGFALYVKNFANYEVVYGALSTLPIFLIWVYLSWMIALIGAEVVAVLQTQSQREQDG